MKSLRNSKLHQFQTLRNQLVTFEAGIIEDDLTGRASLAVSALGFLTPAVLLLSGCLLAGSYLKTRRQLQEEDMPGSWLSLAIEYESANPRARQLIAQAKSQGKISYIDAEAWLKEESKVWATE